MKPRAGRGSAAIDLAVASRATKDAALRAMADALLAAEADVLAANAADVQRARDGGTSEAMIDRLKLDSARLAGMATGLRDVAGLPDPVGEVVRGSTLPNGLELRQIRVPFGVVGIIYEARPNVTADGAGLCAEVRQRGAAARLVVGQELQHRASSPRCARGIEAAGLPADAVQLVPGDTHEAVKHLMRARGLVDVLIPRGGASLIRTVVEESTVPVIETGVGNCHVYVDADADLDAAERILVNAKAQRPSVCNAAETLLVHADVADGLRAARDRRAEGGRGDRARRRRGRPHRRRRRRPGDRRRTGTPSTSSLDIAAGVVASLEDAITHIRAHGSGHTEAIITRSQAAARRFVAAVDAAAVVVNASTRFTDGGEFGFGAEIGISTQKLHARGPMGLPELTSTKYVVTGDGHIRG